MHGDLRFSALPPPCLTSSPCLCHVVSLPSGGDELRVWDQGIGDVCMSVNRLLDEITRKYPHYDTL